MWAAPRSCRRPGGAARSATPPARARSFNVPVLETIRDDYCHGDRDATRCACPLREQPRIGPVRRVRAIRRPPSQSAPAAEPTPNTNIGVPSNRGRRPASSNPYAPMQRRSAASMSTLVPRRCPLIDTGLPAVSPVRRVGNERVVQHRHRDAVDRARSGAVHKGRGAIRGVAMPVLHDALDRSFQLAGAMDAGIRPASRCRSADAPRHQRAHARCARRALRRGVRIARRDDTAVARRADVRVRCRLRGRRTLARGAADSAHSVPARSVAARGVGHGRVWRHGRRDDDRRESSRHAAR